MCPVARELLPLGPDQPLEMFFVAAPAIAQRVRTAGRARARGANCARGVWNRRGRLQRDHWEGETRSRREPVSAGLVGGWGQPQSGLQGCTCTVSLPEGGLSRTLNGGCGLAGAQRAAGLHQVQLC